MLNPEAQNYVNTQLAAGFSVEAIQQALRQAGWSEADVQSAFAPPVTAAPVGKTPSRHRGLKITLIVLGILLFISLLIGAPIVILTSMTVASLNTASSKGDLTLRRANLKQLQNGVELYFSAYASYPDELSEIYPDYITAIPIDPVTGQPYYYQPAANGQDYQLCPPDDQSTAACLTR